MSMITLNGTLINIFKAPEGTNKEGEKYGGQDKVQLLARMELPNGEHRMEMLTLTAHNAEPFRKHLQKQINVPAGAFVVGRNIQWFIPKNASLASLRPLEAA
jgi:hypothetical protein